jgi:hypothetical protein
MVPASKPMIQKLRHLKILLDALGTHVFSKLRQSTITRIAYALS